MSRVISEAEFSQRIRLLLTGPRPFNMLVAEPGCVTGPGRSGAIAAVYASYILSVPFIPFGQKIPEHLRPVLIIDTARESGETLRKAVRKYASDGAWSVACYHEPPRVMFWYESAKPQQYRHEEYMRIARAVDTRNLPPGSLLDEYSLFHGEVRA